MKIGIIGSGDVAQSLAKGLAAEGHEVMIGGRFSDKKPLQALAKKLIKKIKLGSTTEAANFGEMAILAIAWHATEDILAQIRPQLAGKIVIDITNPLVMHDDGPPELAIGHDISGGEMVAQSLPDSHIVKALNVINHAHMVKPKYSEGRPVMFICGNNQSAKTSVVRLLNELGWEDVVELGDITKSRLLEPLCLLWLEYGVARDTWDHAFAVLGH